VTGPDADTLRRFVLGTASPNPAGPAPVTVTGPGCWVLAWLTGRDDGAGLSVAGGGRAPAMPAWS
jgi:hypothetical protein